MGVLVNASGLVFYTGMLEQTLMGHKRGTVRFTALDGLRGIAALMVALFHLPVMGLITLTELVRHSYLFVDFFFVLSGFVIWHQYGDAIRSPGMLRNFVILRFARLYPVHLGSTLVMAAVLLWFYSDVRAEFLMAEGDHNAKSLAASLLLLQSFWIDERLVWNVPSWSISAEFWTYVIFALLVFLFPRKKVWGTIILGALGFFWLSTRENMDVTFELGILRCLAGFACGAFVYQFAHRIAFFQLINSTSRLTASLLEISVCVGVIAFILAAGFEKSSILAPLVFVLPIMVFAGGRGFISSILSTRLPLYLGQTSYAIYMWHMIAIKLMIILVKITGLDSAFGENAMSNATGNVVHVALIGDAVTILTIMFAILLAHMSTKCIEQPVMNWARRKLKYAPVQRAEKEQFYKIAPKPVSSTSL